jgi:hypothetical protein
MSDFGSENVLRFAIESFSETIAVKLQQLRRFVPKEKAKTNTALTGAFIEELVRGFIRNWIGHRLYLHGTFYFEKDLLSEQKPLQIDGIVYDPTRGPVTLREGDFVVVHPAFCGGVIEVKMSVSSLADFEGRLQEVYHRYLSHRTMPSVMGVVIADKDPEKVSVVPLKNGDAIPYYHYFCANLCPIFVLFKETERGDFEPHTPAIEGLIRSIHNNLIVTTNYLG